MREYYHSLVTCPYCHEPHKNGNLILKVNKNEYHCENCQSNFFDKIDFTRDERLVRAFNCFKEKNGESASLVTETPLFWKIEPNELERLYMDWVPRVREGRFLITWPWDTIKFTPLLICSYLLANPDAKIMVVGEVPAEKDKPNRLRKGVSNLEEKIESILYSKDVIMDEIPDQIRKERNILNNFLLRKESFVFYEVVDRGGGSRKILASGTRKESLAGCKRKILSEFGSKENRDNIKKIVVKREGFEDIETELNESGRIVIELTERKQRIGDPSYNPNWLFNVLWNFDKFDSLSKLIRSAAISDDETLNQLNEVCNVALLPSAINYDLLNRCIDRFRPNLLIFTDFDYALARDALSYGRRYELSKYLSELQGTVVLSFSTNQETRYLYNMHKDDSWHTRFDFNVHTWDYDPILEKLPKKNLTASLEGNPFSSILIDNHIGLISGAGSKIRIGYRVAPEMDKLKKLYSFFKEELGRENKIFLDQLVRSPLLAGGDYRSPKVFTRQLQGEWLNLKSVCIRVSEELKPDDRLAMYSTLESVYGANWDSNPLLEAIKEEISCLKNIKGSSISVIVHTYDIKGTSLLLSEAFPELIQNERLCVISWSQLYSKEIEKKGQPHFVLSTLAPNHGYSLTRSRLTGLTFILSEERKTKVQEIIEKRLYQMNLQPVLRPNREVGPDELGKLLDALNIPTNSRLSDDMEEVTIGLGMANGGGHLKNNTTTSEGSTFATLTLGEKAYVLSDREGRKIVVPEKATLNVMRNGAPIEIELDDDLDLEAITGTQIILDRLGLYHSFKAIMIALMMKECTNTRFEIMPYEYRGFLELYRSSAHWIFELRRAVNEYMVINGCDRKKAEDQVALCLSRSTIKAKSADYIKSWWESSETVSTVEGDFEVFNVEHPQGNEDIYRIFEELNKLLSTDNYSKDEANRCSVAARAVQSLRHLLLEGRLGVEYRSLSYLDEKCKSYFTTLIASSETLLIDKVSKIVISREMRPFVLLERSDGLISD